MKQWMVMLVVGFAVFAFSADQAQAQNCGRSGFSISIGTGGFYGPGIGGFPSRPYGVYGGYGIGYARPVPVYRPVYVPAPRVYAAPVVPIYGGGYGRGFYGGGISIYSGGFGGGRRGCGW